MTAYDQAHQLHQRAFWEPSTETIRSCPENYCLAARIHGHWQTGIDAATKPWDTEIAMILNEWSAGSTTTALAGIMAQAILAAERAA